MVADLATHRVARCRRRRGDAGAARRTVRRAHCPSVRDDRSSPIRTGCARRRRNSSRSASRTTCGSSPPGASHRSPSAVNITLDPGTRVWHRRASVDAPVPRVAAAHRHAGCSVLDYGCGSGHSGDRGGKARRAAGYGRRHRSAGRLASTANGGERCGCDVRRRRCAAGGEPSISSSRTSSPIRCGCSRLRSRQRTAAAGPIALAGILVAQADDVASLRYAPLVRHRASRESTDDWALLAGPPAAGSRTRSAH